MSEENTGGAPLCCVCGNAQVPATRFVRVGPWTLAFCEQDYQLSKQFLENMANIRQLLHLAGIHIGVPRGAQITGKGIKP